MSNGLAKALRFIRELQKIDPFLTITQAHTLLIVAAHEGDTIGRILRQSPVSRAAVYRAVHDLEEVRAFKRIGGKVVPVAGHGLVLTRDRPEDQREKEVFLTMRGRALVIAIEEILG